NGNKIFNPNGVSSTSTTLYGIYTYGDAPQGKENLITNNLMYDLNARNTIYAIYNSGADGVHYYHNTIVIDNPTISSSSTVRGFYQTTAASNIELKNNIFSITRGGTGTKHALYFGTTSSIIISDNNVFHIDAASAHVGYY